MTPRMASMQCQVIVLPRCRKRDGGCGSHRVYCNGTRRIDETTVRYYVCKQCGRTFKALIGAPEDEGE